MHVFLHVCVFNIPINDYYVLPARSASAAFLISEYVVLFALSTDIEPVDGSWKSLWYYLIQHFTAYCSAAKCRLICFVTDNSSEDVHSRSGKLVFSDFFVSEYFTFRRASLIVQSFLCVLPCA